MKKGFSVLVALAACCFVHTTAPAGWLDQLKGAATTVAGSGATTGNLSDSDMVSGLKEALRVGSERVVGRLGTVDGFNRDSAVHIPLPDTLRTAQKALAGIGMSGMMDDLELRMNRAAEQAVPKAKKLFADAIADMTIDDAARIYQGPDDAATRYFQEKMSAPLKDEMRPMVKESISQAGVVSQYDAAMSRYRTIPFVPDVKADLTEHVLDGSLAGVFHYLAQEEAAIRRNPAQRTTEILKKVFGGR
ncbi:MAG: DUF4197 domain-containing protein [Thermodesulfobacteriota bacterium]